jgi:hypothetical protein
MTSLPNASPARRGRDFPACRSISIRPIHPGAATGRKHRPAISGCLCFAPHKALQPGRVLRDLRIAVSYWPNERVEVIGHNNCREVCQFLQIAEFEDGAEDLRLFKTGGSATQMVMK